MYIGIAQALFAGLFIAVRKKQNTADKILAVLLFSIAVDMSFTLFKEKTFLFTEIPPVLPLAFGPLVYLYVKALITRSYKFNYKSLLHFIPFTAFMLTTLIFIDKPVMQGNNFFENNSFLPFRITYSITFFSVNTVYSILSFILINKHQKNIKDIFSYTSEKITLNWLKIVLFSFIATYILLYISGLWYIAGNKNFYMENITPVELSYTGLTFFAFAFSFFGFKQLAVFSEKELRNNKPKYLSSGLTKENAEKYSKQLKNIMTEKKPYLNEKLTISDLANMLNISRHHLTQIINENLNKNFYNFVNEYRIEEVKKMLLDDKKKHYSILAIAYECGFNSKSTFNTLFKKYTGITPSEYRKQVQT